MGRSSFLVPGPPDKLGSDGLFPQAPTQGSFPGASNTQTVSEGKALIQDFFNNQRLEGGVCKGREDNL